MPMIQHERVNILMVDDQPAKLLAYEAILGDLGERLIKANSAREALEHLLKSEIAVVLVDVCMPDLDGFELATLIRQHPRCQQTAVILVSAILMTDLDRLKGFEHGAVDYMSVPVVPEILRAKVSIFTELYRKTRELARWNLELENRVAERTADLEASTAKLRESEEQLTLALDSAEAATWTWDVDANVMDGSARRRALYGFAPDEEFSVETWLARIHPEDRERIAARAKLMLDAPTENVWSEEFRINHPTKGERWLSGLGRAVRDETGKLKHITGISFDITQRKRAQDERAHLLQSEQIARADAERANRAKDHFLAIVSHELRTPLNGMLLWVDLLRRNHSDPETVAEGLEAIERNGRSQVRLIEDLLDMSRILSGKIRLEIQPVCLCSAAEAAIATILPLAQAKSITIEKKLDLRAMKVLGDAARLEQIILNLLSNAVKFTPAHGHIFVEVDQRDLTAFVQVRDTGQGIAPEFLPYVFDSFRQADSTTARYHGGLGLGLAIARHLVQLLNGSLNVASPGKDQGATFTVGVPVATFESEDSGTYTFEVEDDFAGNGFRDLRILVVDDDADACELLGRMLVECGACVEVTTSPDDAIQRLSTFRPQILISDIGMPGKDGFQLIREIRTMGHSRYDLPAVAVTAFVRPEDRIQAMKAGYNMYVTKPIERRKLLTALSTLVHEHIGKN